MRAWKSEPKESSKAFAAFEVYRDLGPSRSLREAARIFYGEDKEHHLSQLKKWSRKFDWVERARSFDDWLTMHRQSAVEEHLAARAEDHGRREAALMDRALSIREQALSQVEKMLDWPLSTQRVVAQDDAGEQVTYQFFPAGWSKATAVSLYKMAVADSPAELPDEPVELDLSEMSEEQAETWLRLSELLGFKPPEG